MSKEITQEQIKRFEESTGIKLISFEKRILEYQGQRWRPVKGQIELLCATWDGVPLLYINDLVCVPETYQP